MSAPSVARAGRVASVVARLPMYGSFRTFGWPAVGPLAMTFVVTDRCNSLCKTCHIGRRYLDDPSVADGELSLDEYARIFRTLGRVQWVTLSGGEPFMREDLAELAIDLVRSVSPLVVNIPTNGSFVEATARAVSRIVESLGATRLIVNLSVDGVGPAHDEVRGLRHNFDLLRETMKRLRGIGDRRLTVGANTVISRYNVDRVEEIFDFVLGTMRPDSYVVEAAQIRPEYYNDGDQLAADREALARALGALVRRTKDERRRGLARLVKAFRIEQYAEMTRALERPRGHRCYSGFITCTIMPTGEVWSSTQRADRMGNIREHGGDFRALWRSRSARAARERVRAARCHCETSNVHYTNAIMSVATMPRVLWNYVRYP